MKSLLQTVDEKALSVFPDRCSASGLSIERRPDWENIQVADNYSVSFCVIGEKVLYSIPKGSASDKGSFGFMEHRHRILRESGLDRYRFAEIADYGFFRGAPSSEVRLFFKKVIMEETAAGKLLCIWVFNTSKIIRWYYNVGAAIYKSKLPVGAVRNYADAVAKAFRAFELAGMDNSCKDPEAACDPRIERYREELLSYIRTINWETAETLDTSWDESNPFGQVFEALGSLQQNMVELNRKDRYAAAQLESRNARLRLLTRHLIHAEELEKKKIANDIHDGPTQVIAMLISKIKYCNETNKQLNPGEILQIQDLLEQTLGDMRSLSSELNPPALEKGLAEALGWLARECRQKHDLILALNILSLEHPEIEGTLKVILYRAVHELVKNIIKHSGVKSAKITLSDNGNRLSIRVDDAGKGFDPSTLDSCRPSTFGLFSIAERMRIMKGTMDILSVPGHGTSITLEVPLTPGDARDRLPFQALHYGDVW